MSPALAGVFFTSEPPGKPKMNSYRESKEGEKSLESIVALFYGHICCSSELLPSVLKYMYSHLYLDIFMIMLKQQNWNFLGKFSLAQFSSSVVSNSLRPHGLQHTWLPCPHQLPELTSTHVHWVDDAIQSSHPLLPPFSSCLQSFPASGSFQMCQFFSADGQSIEVSASALVLPMNIQD